MAGVLSLLLLILLSLLLLIFLLIMNIFFGQDWHLLLLLLFNCGCVVDGGNTMAVI